MFFLAYLLILIVFGVLGFLTPFGNNYLNALIPAALFLAFILIRSSFLNSKLAKIPRPKLRQNEGAHTDEEVAYRVAGSAQAQGEPITAAIAALVGITQTAVRFTRRKASERKEMEYQRISEPLLREFRISIVLASISSAIIVICVIWR